MMITPTKDDMTDCQWIRMEPPHPAADFAAKIEDRPDGTPECTIFPTDLSKEERLTTWLTASDNSFVKLAEFR